MSNIKRLNIGIDIDGTITTPYYWRVFFNKLFNKNIEEKDCTTYDLKKLYGADKELWQEVYGSNLDLFYNNVDIRKDAVYILQLLKKQHNCSFITARSNTQYHIKQTKKYLKTHSLDDINLYMLTGHYKVDKCKELGINVFIEDSPLNSLQLAESGIKVFLLNNNYNRDVKHKNITRVNNWDEIYSNIQEEV